MLKAMYGTEDLDREGGFLLYFQGRLQKLLSEPYREEMVCSWNVDSVDGDCIHIQDEITYTCRSIGNKIQETIGYKFDKDEVISVDRLEIKVRYPAGRENEGKEEILHGADQLCPQEGVSVKLDPKYLAIDGLRVAISARYRCAIDRFHYWDMGRLSRQVSLTIHYPAETFHIQKKVFGPAVNEVEEQAGSGWVTLTHRNWLLPANGFVWTLAKKKPACQPGSANEPGPADSIDRLKP